uniref:RNA methyltransferase, TrmH family domain-containing protein, putative n=1 Tax=Neospora caninum (strain Liverpool) TaxID=572307 RepID=A0A0F7UKJ2_NEOCL|nr:TPA: RNA methyltransferase, TrmH family domain-containing protein, putative [Neospora caninum Liverpool]
MGPPSPPLSSCASPGASSSPHVSPASCPPPFSPALAALVRFCTDLSRLPVPGSASHNLLASFLDPLRLSPAVSSQEPSQACVSPRVDSRQGLVAEISDLLLPNVLFQFRLATALSDREVDTIEIAFPVSQLSGKTGVKAFSFSASGEQDRARDTGDASYPDRIACRSSPEATALSLTRLAPLSLPVARLLLESILILRARATPPFCRSADSSSPSPSPLPSGPEALQPFRLLLVLLSSTAVSGPSRREGKAAKKERRRERENKRREKGPNPSGDSATSASPVPREKTQKGKHGKESPRRALSWIELSSLQDRTITTKLACRILAELLSSPASEKASEACRFCLQKNQVEHSRSRDLDSEKQPKADGEGDALLFSPCACALSRGSLWILDELCRARNQARNAEDFQHGELGLSSAEKRAEGAEGDSTHGAGRALRGGHEQGDADETATPNSLAAREECHRLLAEAPLTCDGAVALLEAWMILLQENGEKTELRRLSLRVLPLLHDLCTSSTFQGTRKSIYSRVLPLVLGDGLSAGQASLFLLSLIATLLEGHSRLCFAVSRSVPPLPARATAPSGSPETSASSANLPSLIFPPSSCFVASSAEPGAQGDGVPSGPTAGDGAALEPSGDSLHAACSAVPPAFGRHDTPDLLRTKNGHLVDREDAFDLALRFPDLFFFPRLSVTKRGRWLYVAKTAGNATGPGEAAKNAHASLQARDERWAWLFQGLVDSTPLNRKRSRALLELFQATEQQPLLRALRATRGDREGGRDRGLPSGEADIPPRLAAEADGKLRDFAAELARCGVSPEAQEVGWQAFVQLLEALEDFSQHLVKQQWRHMRRLCALSAKVSLHLRLASGGSHQRQESVTRGGPGPHEKADGSGDAEPATWPGDAGETFCVLSFASFSPSFFSVVHACELGDRLREEDSRSASGSGRPISPLVLQPLWAETVLRRILSHDNALLTRSLLLVFLSSCVEEMRLHPLLAHCMQPQMRRATSAVQRGSAARASGDRGENLRSLQTPSETPRGGRADERHERHERQEGLASSSVWTSSFNLAARAAAAAEGGARRDSDGPPELLCIGWDFFLHALLPSLAASNLYSRSSDSHVVEKTVQRFIKSRLVAEYLIQTWSLHVTDAPCAASCGRPQMHVASSADPASGAARRCPPPAKTENSACLCGPVSGAVPSAQDAFSSLENLPRVVCGRAAERSVGEFLVAMSSCNLTYTPFRVWLQSLNSLATAPPSGPPCSPVSPGARGHSGDAPVCLGRGVSRERLPAFVCLLRQLLQHIPAVVRAPLCSRLLRFLSLHAQPSSLSPLDLALLFADAGAALPAPSPSRGDTPHPQAESGRSESVGIAPSNLAVGQKLLLTVFPDARAFRRALLSLFAVLLRDDPSHHVQGSDGRGLSGAPENEAGACEAKTQFVGDFPRDILCEKVAVGCLRMCDMARGLATDYDVQQEAAMLLFSSPALLRVYSRPTLPSLSVRSKLAALSAFLRLQCTAPLLSSSSSRGHSQAQAEAAWFTAELPSVASEVVAYIVCHLTTLARCTDEDSSGAGEDETPQGNPLSVHALCVSLPVYASTVNALSLLGSRHSGWLAPLIARCEEIVLASGLDPATQTSPRHLLLVAAALTLLSAAAPALLPAVSSVSACERSEDDPTQIEARAQRVCYLFLLVFLAKVNRHLAVQRRLAAPVFCTAQEDSDKGDMLLLATVAASPGGAPAPPLPLAPSEGPDSSSPPAASLFAFSEVGEFSTWPGILSSFHRARATLLDFLASASLGSSSSPAAAPSASLLGRFLHAELGGGSPSGSADLSGWAPSSIDFSPASLSPGSCAASVSPLPGAETPSASALDFSRLPPRLRASLDARMQAARQAPDVARLASSAGLSVSRVVALSLMSEIDGCPSPALPSLFRAIRRFALPMLLLPHQREAREETRAPPETAAGTLHSLHSVLSDFTSQTKRIILDRTETGLPLQGVREACAAVISPLMLATESLCVQERRRAEAGERAGASEDADTETDSEALQDAFVLNFARDLLGIGRSTLSVSRAAVVPLLSSLALLGLHPAAGFCGKTPEAPAAASAPWRLPSPYINLLAEILLHREFVLLDGASVMTVDPFGAAYPWRGEQAAGDDSAVDLSSPLAVLTSSDPAAFFFSPASVKSSLSPAFQPLALPPRLRRLRQTPAFVRLLALSFFHFLGQVVCSELPEAPQFDAPQGAAFRAFAADLLFRVSSRLLDVVTRSPSFSALASVQDAGDGPECSGTNKAGSTPAKDEAPQHHYLPMPNSCHHRILLRGWQALTSFAPFFRAAPPAFLLSLHSRLWKAVATPQLADVRHYIDLLAVQMLLLAPAQSCAPLAELLRTFDAPTQTLIGGLTIAGFYLLHGSASGAEAQSSQAAREERAHVSEVLFAAVVPHLTSNAAYLRGVSQYLVHEFLRKAQVEDGAAETGHASGLDEAGAGAPGARRDAGATDALRAQSAALGGDILRGLYRQLDESKECQKMREKCSEVFLLWQPHILGALETLLAVGQEGDADALDDTVNEATAAALAGVPVPPPACASSGASGSVLNGEGGSEASAAVAQTLLADFDMRPSWALAVALKDAIKEEMGVAWHGKARAPETRDPALASLETHAEKDVDEKGTNGGGTEEKGLDGEKQELVCQRKFVPQHHQRYEEEKGSEDLLSSWLYVGGEGETLQRELRQRGDLIVVASLIDKVPNLAGLARTCEVFDAKKLTIHNLDILNDPQFNTIGVSAHRWLPIEQVAADNVGTYLLDLKSKGYTVVGVEQTGSSEMLENATFERKTALVLGAEKEGLPAALLALMDACIEIPQLGLIRSLNVHVTAAMVVWEYTKQHALGA